MSTMRVVTVLLLALLFLIPMQGSGQNIVRVPPWIGTNFLNNFIMGDTLANGQRRDSNAVYVLQRGKVYAANAPMRNIGWTLRLAANDTTGNVSKPIVYLYPGGTQQLPPGQFVDMRGNATMKNVILTGYFEPDSTKVAGLQGQLFQTSTAGWSLTLDSCILTNTNGNHVRTNSAPKLIKITNCIFANMGYLGTSNLGAGKGIDLRAGSADSVIIVNNTFVNWQDRVIRHFASTAAIGFLKFEHNTCVNGMSYHGFLSLGHTGSRVIIRDNLLVDPFALGQDTDAVRQAEFTDSGEKDSFGFPRMTWVISNQDPATWWTVANNYYRITPDGQAFFDYASVNPIIANPPLVAGSPLTYHINRQLGADSAIAFRTHTADLPKVPKLMTEMMKWYRLPQSALPDSGAGKTKATSMFRAKFDYDRRRLEYYRDTLDCAYSTSDPVYTAGTGGYPVGDLNWFPTRKAAWLNDAVSSAEEPPGVPTEFSLSQNYPNPFNPSTRIEFSLAQPAKVSLTVVDILGRQVATVIDAESRGVGKHVATFSSSGLATGVYFYRLTAGEKTVTMKMMILK